MVLQFAHEMRVRQARGRQTNSTNRPCYLVNSLEPGKNTSAGCSKSESCLELRQARSQPVCTDPDLAPIRGISNETTLLAAVLSWRCVLFAASTVRHDFR